MANHAEHYIERLQAGFSELGKEALQLAFPSVCLVCRDQRPGSSELPICLDCRLRLSPGGAFETCLRCAAQVGPYTSDDEGCPLCRGVRYDFEEVVSLGRYHGDLAQACLKAKQSRYHALTRLLTRLLFEKHFDRLRHWSVDVIVAVPNHWRTRLFRENAAPMWIAHELGALLKTKVCREVVYQARRSQSQHRLRDVLERRRNVRDLYRARSSKEIFGRKVLLVDDIMTSGETLQHIAKLLRARGASKIYAATLARGQRKT